MSDSAGVGGDVEGVIVEADVRDRLMRVIRGGGVGQGANPRPGDAYATVSESTFIVVSEGGVGRPRELIIERRPPSDRRPALDVSSKPVAVDWFRENLGGPALPGFYVKDGVLVRVPRVGLDDGEEDEDGRWQLAGGARIRPVTPGLMTAVVQTSLWPFVEKVQVESEKGSTVPSKITRIRLHELITGALCQPIIEGAAEWDTIPRISAVTHTPMLRSDGSLITRPGYDEVSEVLYLPDPGLSLLEIPAVGSIPEGWVAWARDTLKYLLKDFPFESEGHRANMFALMLTPLMRRVVLPPYPMFLINAHQRGTGKSLLARIARTLHGGVHRPDLSPDDEEIRKSITSVLMTTTAPLVNFDNVTAPIRSGNMANLLTSRTWTDRVLGRSASVECTNDRIWLATGNNIRIGGDMARRVLWVSLDAAVARPELRTDFSEMDLAGYVEKKRGEILSALLVVLGWWVQRGMPRATLMRSDDYSDWTGAMQEILEGSGLVETGVFGDAAAAGDPVVSDDEMELGALLGALEEIWGVDVEFQVSGIRTVVEEGVTAAARLLDEALPGSVRAARDTWKSLGRYMLRHERTFVGDVRLVKVRYARGGIVWKLEKSSV